jgi:TolB-like protein/cytochrome c-type biogenesis protein CcmH/NrfG
VTTKVQRRLAAILAADVAGYSRMMAEDETGTIVRLQAIRSELIEPKIGEHRGRLVKTTGDGMLIEFRSVADAVNCAVEIQRSIAERNARVRSDHALAFRIGINVGEIIVEEDDIFGDGVNIAARLESVCQPGCVYVSGRVHEEIAGKIDLAFDNLGEKTLKNLPRPVRIFRVRTSEAGGKPGQLSGIDLPLSLPDKPSIAVMPFANMSDEATQEYFADGVCEDIIAALSRIHWLFVIARNSSFFYKGRAADVKQIARDLGVRYILEGSVRKLGARVRISTQLVDAAAGVDLWTERYDRELSDIFSLQDEITRQIASAIEPRLLAAEGTRARTRSVEELDAWELVARASSIFWRMTKADTGAAIGMLTEAIRRHPDYGPAHSMLSFAILITRQIGWSTTPSDLQKAVELAERAVELDGRDPWAQLALGQVAVARRQTDAAVFALGRALELNPNFATAHGRLGAALAYDGRSERALQHLSYAMRLSPLDPQNTFLYGNVAMAHYQARRYAEAAEYAGKAVQLRPAVVGAHRLLCACLAMEGQLEDARTALRRVKALQPDLSLAWVEQTYPLTPSPMHHFLEGLRKAGLQ